MILSFNFQGIECVRADSGVLIIQTDRHHHIIVGLLGERRQGHVEGSSGESTSTSSRCSSCYTTCKIGPEQIEALYQYAKFQFECGNYSGAADYVYQYRALCTSAERSLSALWGKLAAEILMQNWGIGLEELNRLKEIIDSKDGD